MSTIVAQICIRRDTAANFTSANPTLALGEIAYETDTGRFKVGTGSTVWTALGYAAQNPTEITGNVPFTSTGAIKIPSGTIAQRPGTPAAGMMRHNTDSSRLEYYNGTTWQNFTVDPLEVEYLIVGGGGGAASGGGGAGGFRTNVGGTLLPVSVGSSHAVIVGAGGAGQSGALNPGAAPNGTNSMFSSITSTGGGGGNGIDQTTGINGGSGGGGGASATLTTNGGNGISGQGSNGGGNGGFLGSPFAAGGGGGASTAGGAATANNTAGNGGAGSASTISGSSATYAGGGGGGVYDNSGGATPGIGGSGGGGNGAAGANTAVSGTANTGGGGGGSGSGGTGGSGGSGIVIIRYAGAPRCTGGTIDTTTVPGSTIHTFTTSGTFALVS